MGERKIDNKIKKVCSCHFLEKKRAFFEQVCYTHHNMCAKGALQVRKQSLL